MHPIVVGVRVVIPPLNLMQEAGQPLFVFAAACCGERTHVNKMQSRGMLSDAGSSQYQGLRHPKRSEGRSDKRPLRPKQTGDQGETMTCTTASSTR